MTPGCPRCGGLLVPDWWGDMQTDEPWILLPMCVNCGAVVYDRIGPLLEDRIPRVGKGNTRGNVRGPYQKKCQA